MSFPCSNNPANLFFFFSPGELTRFEVNNMCNYILFIGFLVLDRSLSLSLSLSLTLALSTFGPNRIRFHLTVLWCEAIAWHATVYELQKCVLDAHVCMTLFVFANWLTKFSKLQIPNRKWNWTVNVVYIKAHQIRLYNFWQRKNTETWNGMSEKASERMNDG